MKIDGLKVALRDGGVTILVRARSDLPLRRIARLPIGALESVRLDAAALGAPEDAPDERLRLELTPMHVQGLQAADLGRDGILVARTVAQGIEFLLDRWVPTGDDEPDATIRELRSRRSARHVRVRELEDLLLKREDDDEFAPPRRRRHVLRRPRFVWTREGFEHLFESVPCRNLTLFLPSRERHSFDEDSARPAAVVERVRTVGAHRVPQWDVLSARVTDDGLLTARGFSDGRWFQCPFARLDPRLVEAFDASGRLVAITDGDPLLGEALEARYLVRVPSLARRATSRTVLISGGRIPEVAAAHPAVFLIDSRSPVALRADLPVVDDPVEAWSILLRTTSGLFLPDAAPTALPRSFLALAGRYVVACTPPAMPPIGGAR